MASDAATEFVSVTGAALEVAEHFLALTAAGGDLQAAVSLYFEAAEAHGRAPPPAMPPAPAATASAGIASAWMHLPLPPGDSEGSAGSDCTDAGAALDAGVAATAAATSDG